jgi:predicted ATP-grasp superfamily ATP-dependent carboligase
MPGYGGTLAAVRCLGRQGIPVTVAAPADDVIAPARWSRHSARTVRCPPATDADGFLEWLLWFGARERRHVLYPTSDDLAFLISVHRDELSRYFDLYQPSSQAIVRLLDKKKLAEACASLGIPAPLAWFPRCEDDVERVAREAQFPVVLKARTQVRRVKQTKGIVVDTPAGLLAGFRSFLSEHEYFAGLAPHFEDFRQPMVQQYFSAAGQNVHSLSGFVDRSGKVLAVRASNKVFQRTQPVGLGVCFETAQVEAALVQTVEKLCASVGHFGVFEVEFLREGERALLIDFNPRFYSQMAFDAARGMPLPLFAYHAALGHDDALGTLAARAAESVEGATIYTQRFIFELILLAERLGGALPASEYARWRSWYAANRSRAVDVSIDPADPLPGLLHAVSEIASGFRALPRIVNGKGRSPRRA